MRKLLVYFISVYQKRISPHKGFHCAHKSLHGGYSCSEYIKQTILKSGVFFSLKNIKQRFVECSDAAFTIRHNTPVHQRGECDLGIGSCAGDGCFDFGSSGSGNSFDNVGCCTDFFYTSNKNRTRNLFIFATLLLILVILGYYFVGRQIDTIDIRLKTGIEETSDPSFGKIFNAQLPDYKINFLLEKGTATTYTLKNTSAKKWITLKARRSIYMNEIREMTIVDKNLSSSKKLETFSLPKKNGEGDKFEYSINKKWELF